MTTVRLIEPDEVLAWTAAMQVAFFAERSAEDEVAYRLATLDLKRTLAAFDDGERVVATFRSFATELTVPGGAVLPADAVTAVTVLPTHRRQGILTAMMAADLRAAAERGEAVAILYASEWPIYGRYGFGPSTEAAVYSLNRAAARFREPAPGTVELLAVGDLRDVAPPIFERFRRSQAGTMARADWLWDAMLGIIPSPFPVRAGERAAIVRDASGEPQGWLRYRVDDIWEEGIPRGRLHLSDCIAATPGAYARLWQFATEIDLVATIVAEDRSVAELLPWLLVDARAVRQTLRTDGLWLRVLDVPATLAGRSYAAEGSCILEVVDDAGFAAGRFRLEAGADGARCAGVREAPELTLGVAALGAAYLGGTSLLTLAAAGLVEEDVPGSLARLEAMFRPSSVPWCSTHF